MKYIKNRIYVFESPRKSKDGNKKRVETKLRIAKRSVGMACFGDGEASTNFVVDIETEKSIRGWKLLGLKSEII